MYAFFDPVAVTGVIYCACVVLQAIFMIPTKPPPSFRQPDKWSAEFIDFVSKCLVKNPENRATAVELLEVSKIIKMMIFFFFKWGWGINVSHRDMIVDILVNHVSRTLSF